MEKPEEAEALAAPMATEVEASVEAPPPVETKEKHQQDDGPQPQQKEPPPAKASVVDSAREEVTKLMDHKELDANDSTALQKLYREHEALKEKIAKLKVLLGRSAKAQRESKVELESTTKKLEIALKDNERLTAKIDKLASRPTHLELLADFDSNFDRAILSVGHQSGGQGTDGNLIEPESSLSLSSVSPPSKVVDKLLMQELAESKQRIDKLEKLNSALLHRSSQLETDLAQAKQSMDIMLNKLSVLELEKRMAVMEAENATKAMNEKSALLAEMQMEIDLVTMSAQKAAVRAAAGEELVKNSKTDKQHVQQLEERVKLLHEWAVASNQAKTLAQERVRILENQIRTTQQTSSKLQENERVLLTQKGSLVVGAGDVGVRVFTLPDATVSSINNSFSEHNNIVLRWTFDLTQADANIYFSIAKGSCCETNYAKAQGCPIRERLVVGGAAGETDTAFENGSSTLVWSNKKSWIRPRTVKYSVQAVLQTD